MILGRHPKLRRNELRATASPTPRAAVAPTRRARSRIAAWATIALALGCRRDHVVPEPPPGTPFEPAHRSAGPEAAPSAAEPRDADKEPPPDPRVDAIVRSQIEPAANHCYEVGIQKNAKESGGLVLLIKVLPDGKVDTVSAGAEGTLSMETVDCIQWVAKRAVFDPPGDAGRMIRVPLTFRR